MRLPDAAHSPWCSGVAPLYDAPAKLGDEMAAPEPGWRIVHAPDVDPQSPEGDALLASLLAGEQATTDGVEKFEVSWEAGHGHPRHRHNTALALAITQGSVTLLLGPDGDRQEARQGDFVLIGAETLHDELTPDGVEMIGAHVGPLETFDE